MSLINNTMFSAGAMAQLGMFLAMRSPIMHEVTIIVGNDVSVHARYTNTVKGMLQELCRDHVACEVSVIVYGVQYVFVIRKNNQDVWLVCAVN
jgi:hypothetical protein